MCGMHADPFVTSFCVAFTFGIAITCMVYMTAHSSGGQLNPAITAGCMVAGATTPVQVLHNHSYHAFAPCMLPLKCICV